MCKVPHIYIMGYRPGEGYWAEDASSNRRTDYYDTPEEAYAIVQWLQQRTRGYLNLKQFEVQR